MPLLDGELAFLLGRTVQGVSAEAVESAEASWTMADLTLSLDDGTTVLIEGVERDTLMLTVSDD